MSIEKSKDDCKYGFHDFRVPLEQYDKPFWLAYRVCSRCGITESRYKHELEKNGDDFRVRYEREKALEKKIWNVIFIVIIFVTLGLVMYLGATGK